MNLIPLCSIHWMILRVVYTCERVEWCGWLRMALLLVWHDLRQFLLLISSIKIALIEWIAGSSIFMYWWQCSFDIWSCLTLTNTVHDCCFHTKNRSTIIGNGNRSSVTSAILYALLFMDVCHLLARQYNNNKLYGLYQQNKRY